MKQDPEYIVFVKRLAFVDLAVVWLFYMFYLGKQLYIFHHTEFFEFPRETIENNKIIGSISGVIFSGVALVTGKMGFALQTNGVDQYVDFGYQGDTCLGYFIRCTHGWVTAFWVRLGYNIGPVFIMDTGMNLRKGQGVVWNPNAQRLTAYLVTESMFLVVSGEATPDQGWIHVVVTWRQCYDAKLYTDGELVATHTGSVLNLPAGPLVPSFVLGASYDNQAKFNGTLDELRVWDTIMSDDEVQAMYTVDAGHK